MEKLGKLSHNCEKNNLLICNMSDKYFQYDPGLLPRREIFLLLLSVISTSITKLQQLANTALVEMARCASGEEGCAKASREDINALLNSLTSTCTACRESCLQVKYEP